MTRWGVVCGALLWLACAGAPPERPDVLLVVLDTVRADRTSTYGYERPTTIQLDALAEAGVVFEDVTAPGSWTWPSHASLFTGEPPWVHGARMVSPRDPARVDVFGYTVSPMRGDLPTLAERFTEAGYRTVSLVVNDWLSPELGLVRGFERAEVFVSDAAAIRAATGAIKEDDPRPLFLFLNFVSAHGPYEAGPGPWGVDDPSLLEPDTAAPWVRPYLVGGQRRGIYLSRGGENTPNGLTLYAMEELEIPSEGFALLSHLYDAGVRGADYSFGRVLDAWVGAYKRGVVAVTSDHGEALGEHGLLNHKGSVYPEVLKIPLVIAAPDRLPAGVRVTAPVQLQDLYPTLLDLAGLSPNDEKSLVPLARGSERDVAPIVAAAWPDPRWASLARGRYEKTWRLYREGRFAVVFATDGDAAELYDVERDPGMERDLVPQDPERARELFERARAWYAQTPESEAEPLAIPEETLERLRRLGYEAGG